MMLMIATNCLAMTFSQPVKIGNISIEPSGGIIFKGTSYNEGTISGKFKNEKIYKGNNGIARWGNEVTGIDAFYKEYKFNFGNKLNNFPVHVMVDTTIYEIENDDQIKMYLLKNTGNDVRGIDYVLFGILPNGECVKYFDIAEFKSKYYASSMYYPNYEEVICQNNSIIIEFKDIRQNNVIGELRFKWDDAAQWFGVEKMVY